MSPLLKGADTHTLFIMLIGCLQEVPPQPSLHKAAIYFFSFSATHVFQLMPEIEPNNCWVLCFHTHTLLSLWLWVCLKIVFSWETQTSLIKFLT